MPKFLVRKAAYTRCEYTEVIEAATAAEAESILDDKEIDGGAFEDDHHYWEERSAEVVHRIHVFVVVGQVRELGGEVVSITVEAADPEGAKAAFKAEFLREQQEDEEVEEPLEADVLSVQGPFEEVS